jgi:predicted aspartyl protease
MKSRIASALNARRLASRGALLSFPCRQPYSDATEVHRSSGTLAMPKTFRDGAAAVLLLTLLCGCAAAPSPETLAELGQLREMRDYFTLRERLEPFAGSGVPEILYHQAAVSHAFNDLERSNATIRPLLESDGIDDELRFRLRALSIKNYARLYRYREALELSEAILSAPVPEAHREDAEDVRNAARLLEALADVPPQSVENRGSGLIRLDPSRRVPLRIGSEHRSYLIDTGANLSVLMRSEAKALGLRIRDAGVEVGTSTDVKIAADVAVADGLAIGRLQFRHVVFLVLPDEHLSFPGGFRIPGLIGFPVIEALGMVRFRADGALEISPSSSPTALRNLVLDELVPLTRVRYGEDFLVCRLDTGASETVFYERFYRRYRSRVEETGARSSHLTTGAGGVRVIPAFTVPRIAIETGGRVMTLRDRPVYTERVTEEKDNYLFCNLGLDALSQFSEYTIDFRSMSFQLGQD